MGLRGLGDCKLMGEQQSTQKAQQQAASTRGGELGERHTGFRGLGV